VLASMGVDETAVLPTGDDACADTGSHELCSLVEIGVLSCAVDFCLTGVCPHAHACDATCGFCTTGDDGTDPAGSGDSGGGHRRTQIDITDTTCDANDMSDRTTEVDAACCNDSNGNCAAGVPTTCDAKCAITYITYYSECAQQIAASFSPQQQAQFAELYNTCSSLPVEPLLNIVATAQQCPAGMGPVQQAECPNCWPASGSLNFDRDLTTYSSHANPWNGRYCAGTVLQPVCEDGFEPSVTNDAGEPMPMLCRLDPESNLGDYAWQTEDGQTTACL
jgi:hypothetical protein